MMVTPMILAHIMPRLEALVPGGSIDIDASWGGGVVGGVA
jgi:hypothetical protein